MGKLTCLPQLCEASPKAVEEVRAQGTSTDSPALLRWLWVSAATFVSQSSPSFHISRNHVAFRRVPVSDNGVSDLTMTTSDFIIKQESELGRLFNG